MDKKTVIYKSLLLIFIIVFIVLLNACSKDVTIKIDYNNGVDCESVVLEKGEILPKPQEPEKYGYIFIEWQVDNKTYYFDKPVESSFILKAVFEKIKEENIEDVKSLFDYEISDENCMELASVVQKYNIDLSQFASSNSDIISLLDFTFNNSASEGITIFYITYLNTVIQNIENNINTLDLSNESCSIIQDVYNKIKDNGFYNLSCDNFKDDNQFLEFIFPIIIGSYNLYNGNAYGWLIQNVLNLNRDYSVLDHYQIYRLKEKVRFLNDVTNNDIYLTFSEIDNLFSVIELVDTNSLDDAIIEYRYVYLNNLRSQKYLNNKEEMNVNSEKLSNIISENKDVLNSFITKISNSYNIIIGLENKFNELKEQLSSFSSLNELKNSIDALILFKDQIVISLNSSIPSSKEINTVKNIISNLNVDNYISINTNKNMLGRFNFLVNNLNELIKGFKSVISVLESINKDNYNFDYISECIYNDEYEKLEDEVNRIYDDLNKSLSKISLFNKKDNDKSFEMIDSFFNFNASSLNNFLSLLLGIIITDDLRKDFIDRYYSISSSIDEESFNIIIEYYIKSSVIDKEYDNDLVIEYALSISSVVDSLNLDNISTNNTMYVNIYKSIYNYNNELNINDDFKVIRKYSKEFKSFYKACLFTNVCKESSLDERMYLLNSFNYIVENFKDTDILMMTQMMKQFSVCGLNDICANKANILNENYLDEVNNVIELINSKEQFTLDEINYINQIGYPFGIKIGD